jgi:hypothetical protein
MIAETKVFENGNRFREEVTENPVTGDWNF